MCLWVIAGSETNRVIQTFGFDKTGLVLLKTWVNIVIIYIVIHFWPTLQQLQRYCTETLWCLQLNEVYFRFCKHLRISLKYLANECSVKWLAMVSDGTELLSTQYSFL